MSVSKIVAAAASSAGGAGLDVDECFSCHLYEGNGSTQTITNNIDLTEGGLVWIKDRENNDTNHGLFDTERGVLLPLKSNTTNQSSTTFNTLTAFNSNGFSLGNRSDASATNASNTDYVSWTFRKAPKFFDVVTWTGSNFGGGRQISHNLGSVPGIIIIKRTSAVSAWYTWHRSTPNSYYTLDSTDEGVTDSTKYYFGDGTNVVAPTSTEFTTQTNNENGFTYIAYLFAHHANDGEFGPDSDQDIIKCGSYTGTGSSQLTVDLGFEPQWLLVKRTDTAKDWILHDTMRGFGASGNYTSWLEPNTSDAEATATADWLELTSTGFSSTSNQSRVNASGGTYIYMAIRRGPLAAPTDATKVFGSLAYTGNGASDREYTVGSAVSDMLFQACRSSSSYNYPHLSNRLTNKGLTTASTGSEVALSHEFDRMDGVHEIGFENTRNQSSQTFIMHSWKRAPSYFDVVAYSGTGSARTQSHNLGAVPEMMWVKGRDSTDNWSVYHKDLDAGKYLQLNVSDSVATNSNQFTTTDPTASVFSVGTDGAVNGSGSTYIAYLFATVAGVSKVGSYTGNGSTQNIDCGFSNSARFVLIKETSGTGDWYVLDSGRGITTSVAPSLYLNNTNAEDAFNIIDPLSSGFIAKGGLNGSGNSYIFYAIA